MPLPDPNFVACFPLQEVFRNKDTGLPLSAGKVYFYRDSAQAVLKPIYELVEVALDTYTFVELNNPMILTGIGTFGDDIGNDIIPYLYPYTGLPTDAVRGDPDLYFIAVYSSGDVFQFSRHAWPPNVEVDSNSLNTFEGSENVISNPQFIDTLLPEGGTQVFTFTGSMNTNIAPDWVLQTVGSGTVTITQENITNAAMPTGAPFAINVTGSAGVTTMKLRQRISNSPRLFALNTSTLSSWVSTSIVAKSFSAAKVSLLVDYIASNGYTVNLLNAQTNDTSTYSRLINSVSSEIVTTNSNGGILGYVDIVITIPTNTSVGITSVQLVSVFDESSTVEYIQESSPRQIDHLFHYYNPLLSYKPIPSMLTGWDFPLNPTQFGSSGNLTASGAYIWDQTIAARGATNVAYQRNVISGGLQFVTPATTDAFYILQYLSGAQAQEIIATALAVNVNAYTNSGAGTVTGKIYLYRGSSAAVIPAIAVGTLGTLSNDGTFTKNNTAGGGQNWTLIPRGGLSAPSFTVNAVSTGGDANDYGFSGFHITDILEINDTDKFAIVVTFAHNATPTEVVVNSISVVKGSIPTRPGTQTPDEVLRECQYYYEKSYASATPVGSFGTANSLFRWQSSVVAADAITLTPTPFEFEFKSSKRSNSPTITYYSPVVGTAATVSVYGVDSAGTTNYAERTYASSWSTAVSGSKAAYSLPGNATGFSGLPGTYAASGSGGVLFHYTCDARLGLVA